MDLKKEVGRDSGEERKGKRGFPTHITRPRECAVCGRAKVEIDIYDSGQALAVIEANADREGGVVKGVDPRAPSQEVYPEHQEREIQERERETCCEQGDRRL